MANVGLLKRMAGYAPKLMATSALPGAAFRVALQDYAMVRSQILQCN